MTLQHKTDKLKFLRGKMGENGAEALYETGAPVVFGVGNPDAELVIVGEAPGEEEAKCGEPFVGPSGQLLDKVLKRLELPRSDVYITNVVKVRPPGNRTPTSDEMEVHAPYLWAELAVIRPKVLLTLGRTATSFITITEGRMGTLRAMKRLRYTDPKHDLTIPVVASWHPSYVLRCISDDNLSPLRDFAKDIKRAAVLMAKEG